MITFYDNNGETWDRYTMYERVKVNGETAYHVYGFSMNCLEPNGFNQYGGTYKEDEINFVGEEVNFEDLPLSVQVAILERLKA